LLQNTVPFLFEEVFVSLRLSLDKEFPPSYNIKLIKLLVKFDISGKNEQTKIFYNFAKFFTIWL
jgi:hypothetical protein